MQNTKRLTFSEVVCAAPNFGDVRPGSYRPETKLNQKSWHGKKQKDDAWKVVRAS